MRRGLGWVLVGLIVSGTALATGFGGDSPPTRIPVPARIFQAQVEDRSGTVVEVTRVTFNGEVVLYGDLGAAQVTVPFEKLDFVTFKPGKDEDHQAATATLVDGTEVTISVESDTPCYGETTFGYYQIEAEDIRRVKMLHRPE